MNQSQDDLSEEKEVFHHNWVQFDHLNDICSKCDEMAYYTGGGGIKYPDTPCPVE